ncbi:MAG: NAD-dependent epimerase/dehydratase family protein [Minisyncoccota bacterium]
MTSVAVVGANGFVGAALCRAIEAQGTHTVTPVTRENYDVMRTGAYDILINAAMPAARFAAKNDPQKDFIETVEKTAQLLYGWRYSKFVQISTVSARCQLDTVYGRHKAAAEQLCDFSGNLIVRLGAMYSPEIQKGVLVDMAKGQKVYVDGDSRYCFAPRDFVVRWIAEHLEREGIVEVGARNAIALRDIAKHLKKDIVFEGALDHQEIVSPESDFPDARDVLSFMDSWKVQ